MASLNRVVVMGNLGQDPELRHTQSQNAVCTLNVATTDVRTDKDGQRQEFTEWHRIVVWGRQAENCAKYLTKGRSVLVEGRLATRSWDDTKTGQKRYVTEIVAQNVQFIGGGREGRSATGDENASFSGGGGGGGGGYGGGGGGGGGGGNRGNYGGGGGANRGGQDRGGQQRQGFEPDNDYGGSYGGPETPALDDIPF